MSQTILLEYSLWKNTKNYVIFLMRTKEPPIFQGKKHRAKNVYVFSGILYCGKCGINWFPLPADCRQIISALPLTHARKKRKTHECDNPSVNDLIVGEFVINYILNMLNAKSSFSSINSPAELEERLLYGGSFKDVQHISEDGLNEFYNLYLGTARIVPMSLL